ncbi:MAG TPA: hypothetical protein VIM65_11260 [Cyclobacteriaceae bacterium]
MNFLFSFTNKYRSDLEQEEVFARIDNLLKSKSKFLFFSIHQYFGAASENEFTLTRQKFDWWGMMSSRLKGRVFNEGGTVIRTRITIPWVIVAIFLFVTVTALFAILKADEMTVNGEIRQADFSLKALMVLLVFVFPACMIFTIAILPAKLIERKIVKLLELQRTP